MKDTIATKKVIDPKEMVVEEVIRRVPDHTKYLWEKKNLSPGQTVDGCLKEYIRIRRKTRCITTVHVLAYVSIIAWWIYYAWAYKITIQQTGVISIASIIGFVISMIIVLSWGYFNVKMATADIEVKSELFTFRNDAIALLDVAHAPRLEDLEPQKILNTDTSYVVRLLSAERLLLAARERSAMIIALDEFASLALERMRAARDLEDRFGHVGKFLEIDRDYRTKVHDTAKRWIAPLTQTSS